MPSDRPQQTTFASKNEAQVAAKTESKTTPVVSKKSAASTESQEKPQIDLKFDWYQNMTHTFVAYKVRRGGDALSKGRLKVDITKDSVDLEDKETGEILATVELSNNVIPAESSFTCHPKTIEIKLKKEVENANWVSLEKTTATSAASSSGVSAVKAIPAANTGPPPSHFPSSSKKKKNWDALEKEFDKEMDGEKPEGDQALNGLFKQIYERSDEATRRAMIKSYQTSGGTVLSTNWGEVADKDYEGQDRPSAPDGQKWAKDD